MNNKKENPYLDLLKEIKKQPKDDKYEPKNYNFNLDNFDKNGLLKK